MLNRENEIIRFLAKAFVWIAYIDLIMTLVIFQYGFYVYHITPFLWEVKDADVIEVDPYRFLYKGNEFANVRQATIEYTVNDTKKQSLVLLSYCEEEGDRIKIAVNKKKSLLCIRYRWLPLSDDLKFANCVDFIVIIIAQIYSFLAKRKRRKSNVISITTNNYQKTDDTSQQEREFRRQLKLNNITAVVFIGVLIFFIIMELITNLK